MNAVIIIPARYNSTRFPGKPLVDILGESLIYRVWKQCAKCFSFKDIYVATDDDRIKEHCKDLNIQYIMTSKDCLTGTDRVFQAYRKLGKTYDCIVNVQGDEPLISPDDILRVIDSFYSQGSYGRCCGFCKIRSKEEFISQNTIKVVFDKNNRLLYASRAPIPSDKKLGFNESYKQVCIYAFSPNNYIHYEKTRLESIEDIEILRFLELGYPVKMVRVSDSSVSVDIPEDIIRVEKILKDDR